MAKTKNSNPHQPSGSARRTPVPLLLILGGAVILLIIAVFAFPKKTAAPYTPEVTGAPALQADQERVDLGDVKLGTTVNVSFQLKNVGDQPLRFSKPPYMEVVEGC